MIFTTAGEDWLEGLTTNPKKETQNATKSCHCKYQTLTKGFVSFELKNVHGRKLHGEGVKYGKRWQAGKGGWLKMQLERIVW